MPEYTNIQLRAAGRFLLLLLLAQFLIACGPSLTPVAVPTPVALVVQITPALQPLGEAMRACTGELTNTGLVLQESPAGGIQLEQATLGLRWGMQGQPQGYAAVIGQDELVIITNPKNPQTSISLSDLRALYQGRLRGWPANGSETQLWAYPSGDDTQQAFESSVLDGQPLPNNVTYTAPDPAAMLEAIAAAPNAIGFLPRRWLKDSVRAVSVQGLEETRARHPIVVVSKSEPRGAEKAWLLCLQERLKE